MVHRTFGYIGYFDRESCDLDEFKVLTSQQLQPADVPHAAGIEKNVPIYDMTALRSALDDPEKQQSLMSEWAWVLRQSAGVIALKRAYADTSLIDRASDVFNAIIADEKSQTAGKGDHFATSGANDRVWNSLQKQCLRDPEGFALYFGNLSIAAACEAWLGPNYQMTAQVNQVRPGGKAQKAHRDYHLGFQSADQSARYPAHAHEVTATLTLQGAVAHCDMPLESGPTKLLPFSQLYPSGYLAFHREDHSDYFEANHVQVALEKGDAVFFNPALFHAAGENRSSDINRMVNLLQVSSAFGRAMEAVDRRTMSAALFPELVALKQGGRLSASECDAAIAACAEGYSFPTNLDTDPPIGGNAPESQADMLRRALEEGWTNAQFRDALSDMAHRQAA
ncbi:phytanoyl-CoA dioxygenase family protein [Marivita geojedonensis]|uniref:Phytanoyl-CoA dioxygenase n=1 Tax=Marivita geojedonensis TaxID=1123756 RepID=A0A1X4NK45_9RHOB|nr:phytanoyl-CoA dioxygenase family protein [Marivita geojedonensis]OSQ50594.1 phytanoyl-CoA dioxygenase [Marivita geojedonensis]PRY79838.1 ectoine hydroxylase-related dioxygenase (phytanoyl-CoA dioxygenase family) [Marivita geojedonensis]